jgi:hypothetical protein
LNVCGACLPVRIRYYAMAGRLQFAMDLPEYDWNYSWSFPSKCHYHCRATWKSCLGKFLAAVTVSSRNAGIIADAYSMGLRIVVRRHPLRKSERCGVGLHRLVVSTPSYFGIIMIFTALTGDDL